MNWPLLAGSVAGVLGLALAARLLRLGGGAISSEEEARRLAEAQIPGFSAVDAFLSIDGQAALVLGGDGSLAVLKLHGAQVASRRLPAPAAMIKLDERVTVVSGERMFGAVHLLLSAQDRDRLRALIQGEPP